MICDINQKEKDKRSTGEFIHEVGTRRKKRIRTRVKQVKI